VGNEPLDLSQSQIHALLEQAARERFGLTAFDLMKKYRQGELDDPGAVADLLPLACLLAKDDPLFAGHWGR